MRSGSGCYEFHPQNFNICPKKITKDKAYGTFPAPVIKTKEQQKPGKTLFQAYQVIIIVDRGHRARPQWMLMSSG